MSERLPTAFELDMALQRIRALAEGRAVDEMCDGLDHSLPCMKIAGHDGPHYHYRP